MTTREEFEKAIITFAEQREYAHMASVLERDEDGYSTTWVDMMWEGWKLHTTHYEAELLKRDAVIVQKDEALRELRMSLDPSDDFIGDKLMVEHIDDALFIQPDNCRLVAVKWEARTPMDGSYFPGSFVPITKDQHDSEEWSGFDRRVLYTIVQEGVE